jgi:hypothetical protein
MVQVTTLFHGYSGQLIGNAKHNAVSYIDLFLPKLRVAMQSSQLKAAEYFIGFRIRV